MAQVMTATDTRCEHCGPRSYEGPLSRWCPTCHMPEGFPCQTPKGATRAPHVSRNEG